MKKVVYAEAEEDSAAARHRRLKACGIPCREECDQWTQEERDSFDVLNAGQVFVCLRGDDGKAYFAGGFKKMSSIGKSFQKLCRPMKPIAPEPG